MVSMADSQPRLCLRTGLSKLREIPYQLMVQVKIISYNTCVMTPTRSRSRRIHLYKIHHTPVRVVARPPPRGQAVSRRCLNDDHWSPRVQLPCKCRRTKYTKLFAHAFVRGMTRLASLTLVIDRIRTDLPVADPSCQFCTTFRNDASLAT